MLNSFCWLTLFYNKIFKKIYWKYHDLTYILEKGIVRKGSRDILIDINICVGFWSFQSVIYFIRLWKIRIIIIENESKKNMAFLELMYFA